MLEVLATVSFSRRRRGPAPACIGPWMAERTRRRAEGRVRRASNCVILEVLVTDGLSRRCLVLPWRESGGEWRGGRAGNHIDIEEQDRETI